MRLVPVNRQGGGTALLATPEDLAHPDVDLVYSTTPNRAAPTAWSGTLPAIVYGGIFENQPEIARVQFFHNPGVDLPEQSSEVGFPGFLRGDSTFPWDRNGGTTNANPWDTTTESSGPARLVVRVTYVDGFVRVFEATATIDNSGDPEPPGAPILAELVSPAFGQLRPTWSVPANSPLTYEVQHSATELFTSPTTVAVPAPSTFHLFSALVSGTYHVRVRAVNAAGAGDWSNSLSAIVVAAPDPGDSEYGEGFATGVTTGAAYSRGSTQSQLINTATTAMPAQIGMTNVDRRVSMATSASKRNGMKNLPAGSWTRWNAGFRPAGTTFDGPQGLLFCTLGWGVNAKRPNNNVLTLHRLAETANGVLNTAWIEVLDSWIGETVGGFNDWPSRMIVRLGQELGPFFPDFPGIDSGHPDSLVGRVGNTAMYPAHIKAAMDEANVSGDRFPVWKLAWDQVVGLARAHCLAAGKTPPLFLANFVHGDADPGDSGPNGPLAQYVPGCATDVDETPDIIGIDIYGRGSALRPRLIGLSNGDPANYDFSGLIEVLEQHANLCLQVNRPASFPEWWSNRKRNGAGGGGAWNDTERAAYTRFMFEWIDTGCGGRGVPVHSHSMFHQRDSNEGDQGQRQKNNNYSYTFLNDALPYTVDIDGSPAPTPAPAPSMRQAMAELFPPSVVNLG